MKFRKIAFTLFLSILSFIGYSQISVGTNFSIIANLPIDNRMVVKDTTDRNNIVWKYDGLTVYVTNTKTNYQLRGAIWVSLEQTVYTAGTGLSISGNSFIHNPHTGDVTGTTSLTIAAIQGRTLATTAPSSGDVLGWNGSAWSPVTAFSSYAVGTGLSLSGNTFNALNNSAIWNANRLMGSTISTTTPSNNQLLKWTGSEWIPSNENAYTAGSGITLTGNTFSANNTSPIWNANQIMGTAISTLAPSNNQLLKWNGTEWVPADETAYEAGTGIILLANTFTADNLAPIWNANLLWGNSISSALPNNNQLLKWNGTEWIPADETAYAAGTGIILSGNTFTADNTSPIWNANQIMGSAVSSVAPASNNVLTWNGSAWVPAASQLNFYDAGTGLTLTSNTFSAQNNVAMWNANQLQSTTVSATVPTNNQILKYSGGTWTPSNENVYDAGTGISLSGNSFSHIAHTGDATGSTSLTVTGLQGRSITTATPTTGNVLKWNGTVWAMGNSSDTFNGNKTITRPNWTGVSNVNMGTNTNVADFLNAVFFPFISATISISNPAVYEIGTSNSITISGTTTPNSETVFSGGRLDRILPTPITNMLNFGAALSYSTTVSFIPVSGVTSSLDLRFVAYQNVGNNGSPSTINSPTRISNAVYPYLYGVSTTDFTTGGTAPYTGLTKLIEIKSNKTVTYNGAGYIYFCYPISYGTLTSILDQNSWEQISAFNLTTQTISSTGLVNNWSTSYYIYSSKTISTPTNNNFTLKY